MKLIHTCTFCHGRKKQCKHCQGTGKLEYKPIPDSVYAQIEKLLKPYVGEDDVEGDALADVIIIDRRIYEPVNYIPLVYGHLLESKEELLEKHNKALINLHSANEALQRSFRHYEMAKYDEEENKSKVKV